MRNYVYLINHKAVLRLMNQCGLKCMVRKKKYHSYRVTIDKTAPNVLQRDFSTTGLNQKCATEISEFNLFGQKIYISPIMDLHNQEIISCTISNSPNLAMVTQMLDDAFDVLPKNVDLIVHSDQGWHYQHFIYLNMLKEKGITQNMSIKGNCFDNAIIEIFFGILKSELLYLQEFESMEQFVLELKEYIDYYNNNRIKLKLKGMTPVQIRTYLSSTS